MDKAYDHSKHEQGIYKLWEDQKIFSEKAGKAFTILMPPPNANASLHAGHAMYTVDDILIRFKRMQGYNTQWIPGTDHAGFETQFVYEKHLAKQDKSRFDFDRQTLYEDLFNFVKQNSGLIFKQMKRLGFSANWERSVFTLDDNVVSQVLKTFKKMQSENLVYRDDYIVNYCTHDGTSLAELEVKHVERTDPLYYVRYPLVEETQKYVIVATVRPEPIYIDTHLAVNPKDNKNKHLIGKQVKNPLTDKPMEIISDDYVDPDFGTGVVKLTPAHDPNDFEVAKAKNLPIVTAIDFRGKMIEPNNSLGLNGLKTKAAREKVVQILQNKGLIEKIDDNYSHAVVTCYKCGRDLEPLTAPNWFIKVEKLKAKVKAAVETDEVKFYPKRYKRHMLQWLDIMHDWPISRQIVWGIRIPAWYSVKQNPRLQITFLNAEKQIVTGQIDDLLLKHSLQEIKNGLQVLVAPADAEFTISEDSPGEDFLQETDTFDTWFSSSQWPIITSAPYPSDVLATYADILKFWVSRMIMFGLYLKNEVPFRDVYLWSMVADKQGKKMSKSKGNVVNPIDLVDKYGADALRMSLVYGIPAGSKVILSEDKVRGMRNFSNKIWNASRYVLGKENDKKVDKGEYDSQFEEKLSLVTVKIGKELEKYNFNIAAETVYEEFWHWYCDICIEKNKAGQLSDEKLLAGLKTFLALLHPFMPFVTEAIWQQNKELFDASLLATSPWPTKLK